MPLSTPLRRVSIFLEGLRVSLVVGATWDLSLAAVLLVAPAAAAARLGAPSPGASWFLPFAAVLLAGHAMTSLLAVTDPISYRGNAVAAGIVRLARSGALAAMAVGHPDLSGLLPLVAVDGLLGLVHLVGWWRGLR